MVVTAGLRGLGRPLIEKHVHRPELFSRLSGIEMGEAVSAGGLIRVLVSENGGQKGILQGVERIALLNQVDTNRLAGTAKNLAEALLPGFLSQNWPLRQP